MNRSGPLAYDCAPTITWVKDGSRIIIVEEQEERFWSLQGKEAVIWDLLTLKYSFARMLDFLAVLSEGSREGAAATLLATIRHWEKEGIVTADSRNRDG